MIRQAGLTLVEIGDRSGDSLAIISAIAIPVYQGYVTERVPVRPRKTSVRRQLLLDDRRRIAISVAPRWRQWTSADCTCVWGRSGWVTLHHARRHDAWLDPWGNIYRYQRADNTTQDCLLFAGARRLRFPRTTHKH